MAHIKLDNTQTPLIQAAIDLGAWMMSLPQLTEQDRDAVMAIQSLLQQLPTLPDNTLAMYGFSIERGDATKGLVRGWDVSLEFFADDPEQQGGLELFSSWLPIPESTDAQVLAEKKQQEAYFHWQIGDVCNFIPQQKTHQWLHQVSAPAALIQPGDRLRLEIVYQDYYSEVDVSR